jgi:hypothetical protein
MKNLFVACSSLVIPKDRLPEETAFYASLAYELICGNLIPRKFMMQAAKAKLRNQKYKNAVNHRKELRKYLRKMRTTKPQEWPVWDHFGIYPFVNVGYGPDYEDDKVYLEPLFHLQNRWDAVRQSIGNMGGIRSFLKHEAWAPFFKIVFQMISQEDVDEILQLDKHCASCHCELLVEERIHR